MSRCILRHVNKLLGSNSRGETGDHHPGEVRPIYQRQIEPTLARTNSDAYRAAVSLLRQVHALLAQLGREAEFGPYLDSVRSRFKMKRNFVKLLERSQWG
jgi:uncharacterized Zn finger protein